MISVRVLNRQATAINRWPITSGSVGLPVDFIFSTEWDELTKTAIFRGSGEAIDVVLTDDSCVVPWETLAEAGGDLYIGVYGSNGDDVVIPTVWCNAGYIKEGAMRSEVDPADPTPSWADQVQRIAAETKQIAESVRTDADNGAFDGEAGPEGPEGPAGPIGPTGAPGALFWQASNEPIQDSGSGTYTTPVSNLSDQGLANPKAGDIVFYSYFYYQITSLSGDTATLTMPTSIRGGPLGQLWATTDVYLLRQVLSHLKYDSDSAGVLAEALLASLEGRPENTGWSAAQIEMLDSLLDHVKYTDEAGGVYADTLIEALSGELVEVGGTVTLTSNGTYNIGQYANAVVNTPVISPYDYSPAALGTASPGTSSDYARGDHVHPLPTAAAIGAIAEPASGSVGQVLKKTAIGAEWADESGGTTEIFWCTDSTTGAQIDAAVAEGKLPMRKDSNGAVYVYRKKSENSRIFCAVDDFSIEQEVRDNQVWGHASLTIGDYSKPSGGIPASDLASAVQTSLGKADTALQSYTETDPTVPSWAKAAAKPSYTASEVGAIAAPSSPATGAFLVWDGTAWTAQTLSTWQGGFY